MHRTFHKRRMISGTLLKIGASILILGSSFAVGYHYGQSSKELEYAIDKVQAVTTTLKQQRQRQNEMADLNRSLSADNERLNRLLKSTARMPGDLSSCVKERDRLRELVKDAAVLVTECRRGLGYCDSFGR